MSLWPTLRYRTEGITTSLDALVFNDVRTWCIENEEEFGPSPWAGRPWIDAHLSIAPRATTRGVWGFTVAFPEFMSRGQYDGPGELIVEDLASACVTMTTAVRETEVIGDPS